MSNELRFSQEKEESTVFELNLVVRDAEGNQTNRRKTIKTNDANKLSQFWLRYRGKPKRRKKKKENVPAAKEANKILRDMYKK